MKYILIIILAVVIGCSGDSEWCNIPAHKRGTVIILEGGFYKIDPDKEIIYISCTNANGVYRAICSNGGFKYE